MRAHLLGGFALCVAAIVAIVVASSLSTFGSERARSVALLRAAATAGADYVDPAQNGVHPLLSSLAADPALASLEPAECAAVFRPLASIASDAHAHVLDPDGREVCGIRGPEIGDEQLAVGSWFPESQESSEPVDTDPFIDPLSGEPSILSAVGIPLPDGRAAVLVAVVYLGADPLLVQGGLGEEIALVAVSADGLVFATSASAPIELASDVSGSSLGRAIGPGSSATVDGRIYTDAPVPGTEWRVLSSMSESIALEHATGELRRIVAIGLVAVVALALLGLVLLRRLATPVRRVERAIEASWHGDDDARAPVTGPLEIARVAEVFNELIEERQARERGLQHRATHDPLTGLLNRAGLEARLAAVVGADPSSAAVLFIDVDRFKLLNDAHGHSVGDAVLVDLAARLAALSGPELTIGRFGGDEFLAICTSDQGELSFVQQAERIIDSVRTPIGVGGVDVLLTASVGIACGAPGVSTGDLIRNADTAMYRAKDRGRARWELFDEEMWKQVSERLEIERALHGAVERGEMLVHYQPIVTLATGAIHGVEALVRWQHPERGMVPPGDFLSVAEESGQIAAIDRWVLGDATAQAARWSEELGRPISVSVNVSAVNLASRGLLDDVRRALLRSSLPPQQLVIELTETVFVEDMAAATGLVNELRSLGVRVAMDDFGTGYSSLAYLQQLPIDRLKIDRAFISRLGTNDISTTIVQAVTELGAAMGIEVVAEGVETAVQAELLAQLGCPSAQGFLLGRPTPEAAMGAIFVLDEARSGGLPTSN